MDTKAVGEGGKGARELIQTEHRERTWLFSCFTTCALAQGKVGQGVTLGSYLPVLWSMLEITGNRKERLCHLLNIFSLLYNMLALTGPNYHHAYHLLS